jgi:hypothetical protein
VVLLHAADELKAVKERLDNFDQTGMQIIAHALKVGLGLGSWDLLHMIGFVCARKGAL